MISFKKSVLLFTISFLTSCGSFKTRYKCPPVIEYSPKQQEMLSIERQKAGNSEPVTDFVLEDYHKQRKSCQIINKK